MATNYTDWLSCSPDQGSGDSISFLSADENTGRVARARNVIVTAVGVSKPCTVRVDQKAKAEFVSFDDGASRAADKTASTITITGLSNSTKLSFSWVNGTADILLPETYLAGGTSTTNGSDISGDPGASAQYAFSITLEIPLNDTIEEVTRVLKVTAAGGQVATLSIVQAAGDPRIIVDPQYITISAEGSETPSITIYSNTSWTITDEYTDQAGGGTSGK
jgi:hypothetical protein